MDLASVKYQVIYLQVFKAKYLIYPIHVQGKFNSVLTVSNTFQLVLKTKWFCFQETFRIGKSSKLIVFIVQY